MCQRPQRITNMWFKAFCNKLRWHFNCGFCKAWIIGTWIDSKRLVAWGWWFVIYWDLFDVWFTASKQDHENTTTWKRFPQYWNYCKAWWRHQMETFSALLAICAGNSPVTGEFPAQKPLTRSFDFFFDLHLNKRLCKQSLGWWVETPSPIMTSLYWGIYRWQANSSHKWPVMGSFYICVIVGLNKLLNKRSSFLF